MNVDTVADRVRAEFVEMPGLTLTVRQASRLFGLDQEMCRQVVDRLVGADSSDGPARVSSPAAIANRRLPPAWPGAPRSGDASPRFAMPPVGSFCLEVHLDIEFHQPPIENRLRHEP